MGIGVTRSVSFEITAAASNRPFHASFMKMGREIDIRTLLLHRMELGDDRIGQRGGHLAPLPPPMTARRIAPHGQGLRALPRDRALACRHCHRARRGGDEPLEGGVVHIVATTLLSIFHEALERGGVIALLDLLKNAGSIWRRHPIGILVPARLAHHRFRNPAAVQSHDWFRRRRRWRATVASIQLRGLSVAFRSVVRSRSVSISGSSMACSHRYPV